MLLTRIKRLKRSLPSIMIATTSNTVHGCSNGPRLTRKRPREGNMVVLIIESKRFALHNALRSCQGSIVVSLWNVTQHVCSRFCGPRLSTCLTHSKCALRGLIAMFVLRRLPITTFGMEVLPRCHFHYSLLSDSHSQFLKLDSAPYVQHTI